MNSCAPGDKVDVVRRYLATCFPDGTVVHGLNFDATAVAKDVFEQLPEVELGALLTTHRLGDRMRQAAPHCVTLTMDGVLAPPVDSPRP